MVAELTALMTAIVFLAAELLHQRRVGRLAPLAFGPRRRPALWALMAPWLRIVAGAALAWGLVTLWLLPPKVHRIGEIPENERRDLLLLLDVSPSMRLQDAGPTGKESRRKRAVALLDSFFGRVPMDVYRTTVVAFYTEAKPVVLRTTDPEVVRNILEDLPMEYAFKSGPTDLFSGLKEAMNIAHPWRPKSATLVIVSDGDTIPPTGIPKLPISITGTLIVGVGDVVSGKFIDGHQSRQDASSLRQLAVRVGGTYHNGNDKQIPTDLIREVTFAGHKNALEMLTRREYALIACGVGSLILALLPMLLHFLGTSWRPGVPETSLATARRGVSANRSARSPSPV